MTWTCEQIEERLSEYIDRLLSPAEQGEFGAHAQSCARCARLVAQVSSVVAEIHRIEPVEPPPQLVTAILERTLGPRAEKKGWRAWLGWFQPVLQPRFAMGAVTVLLTGAIVFQALGLHRAKLNVADLNPLNLYRAADRRAHLLYGRGVKFVNDLRVVYEIQSRLQPTPEPEPVPQTSPGPGQTNQQTPRRQNNRADEFKSVPFVLAAALGGLPAVALAKAGVPFVLASALSGLPAVALAKAGRSLQ